MSKDTRTGMVNLETVAVVERACIEAVDAMCQESLPPAMYSYWETIEAYLLGTRKAHRTMRRSSQYIRKGKA